MIIREFAKPVTSKTLNEQLAAKFNQKIDLSRFTLEQLQDVRNKMRTKLSQVETMESFDSVQNETYQKSRMMMDVLNAAISERGGIDDSVIKGKRLKEGAEDTAELVMAAKDMVDRVTGWMEDTAEMQTESMLELADAIRAEMGNEASELFTGTVKPALDSLFASLEQTRVALTQGVGQLTGEAEPAVTMGAEDGIEPDMEPVDDMAADPADMDPGMSPIDLGDEEDDFGAAGAAAGGTEPGARARRESIDRRAKPLNSKKK